MTRINYKSDFDFLLALRDAENRPVGWPDCDWVARFRTSSAANTYTASCIGGKTVNCYNDNGKIHVVCDAHKLSPGRLQVELHCDLPDAIYPDGHRHEVTPLPLDIELVNGPGDGSFKVESNGNANNDSTSHTAKNHGGLRRIIGGKRPSLNGLLAGNLYFQHTEYTGGNALGGDKFSSCRNYINLKSYFIRNYKQFFDSRDGYEHAVARIPKNLFRFLERQRIEIILENLDIKLFALPLGGTVQASWEGMISVRTDDDFIEIDVMVSHDADLTYYIKDHLKDIRISGELLPHESSTCGDNVIFLAEKPELGQFINMIPYNRAVGVLDKLCPPKAENFSFYREADSNVVKLYLNYKGSGTGLGFLQVQFRTYFRNTKVANKLGIEPSRALRRVWGKKKYVLGYKYMRNIIQNIPLRAWVFRARFVKGSLKSDWAYFTVKRDYDCPEVKALT